LLLALGAGCGRTHLSIDALNESGRPGAVGGTSQTHIGGGGTSPGGAGVAHGGASGTSGTSGAGGASDQPFEPSAVPRDDFWITDGTVSEIARSGNTVYIGGDFSYVGPLTGSLAVVNGQTGARKLDWPRVDGAINAVVSDGEGGVYIGGSFTAVGGEPRSSLAHIEADGTLDPEFYAGIETVAAFTTASALVRALVLSDGTLYAGGEFTSIGGEQRSNIAALDATTGAATAWDAQADDFVHALALRGNTLYAGGEFTSIGGASRSSLAALDAATGAATAWDPGSDGLITCLAVSGNTVYAGGWFRNIGGGEKPAGCVALDAVTGAITPWDPAYVIGAESVAVSGDIVYVGALFRNDRMYQYQGIAAYDAVTGAAPLWTTETEGYVDAIAVTDETVYIGGRFRVVSWQGRSYLAALDRSNGRLTDFKADASSSVNAFVLGNDTVFVGGAFDSIGGERRNGIAALDASTGVATPWDPKLENRYEAGNPKPNVYAIALEGNTVYATGLFDHAGGEERWNTAGFDPTSGELTPFFPYGRVSLALAPSDDAVFAAGNFGDPISPSYRDHLAALEPMRGDLLTWDAELDNQVEALFLSGNILYAGGAFQNAGEQHRNHLVALDATTGAATAWDPNADAAVRAFASSGSTLFVAGAFASIGGQSRDLVAAVDLASGRASDWNAHLGSSADTFDYVTGLAVGGGTVYVVGNFHGAGGQDRNFAVGLDAVTAAPTDWNPDFNNAAYAVAVSGRTLYVGGVFYTVGGRPRKHLAVFEPK
jgi:hypothetical protein